MFSLNKNRLIFYLIFVYILASFGWWSLLFLRQNKRAYQQDIEELRIQTQVQGREWSLVESGPEARSLKSTLQRKNLMIAGEGLVFLTLLSIGFWRINRTFTREIEMSRQQNNFLLSITHELKSPLASIKLGMETLRRRALSPEQVHRISGLCLEDTERLERMVENILMASRMEDPRHRFDLTDLDFSSLASRMAENIRRRYPNQSLELQIAPDLYLHGDEQALSSVLLNLLDNALKYSPPESAVALDLSEQDGSVLLRISDRGPGIPEGEKSRVFRRFYRIGNEETRSSKGTGLGLFIVQEIIRAHQGQIRILDRPGGGSVFEVRLPQALSELPEPLPV